MSAASLTNQARRCHQVPYRGRARLSREATIRELRRRPLVGERPDRAALIRHTRFGLPETKT
jgi:hypothetical protein